MNGACISDALRNAGGAERITDARPDAEVAGQ
jgi:hypothetical protein